MLEQSFNGSDICIRHRAGTTVWQVVTITGHNPGGVVREAEFGGGPFDTSPRIEYQTDPVTTPWADHLELRGTTDDTADQTRVFQQWVCEYGPQRLVGKTVTLLDRAGRLIMQI
jgi:hypothetical protein